MAAIGVLAQAAGTNSPTAPSTITSAMLMKKPLRRTVIAHPSQT
jgi:hypothetical protein